MTDKIDISYLTSSIIIPFLFPLVLLFYLINISVGQLSFVSVTKIPDKNDSEEKNFTLGSWFQEVQSVVGGLHCSRCEMRHTIMAEGHAVGRVVNSR